MLTTNLGQVAQAELGRKARAWVASGGLLATFLMVPWGCAAFAQVVQQESCYVASLPSDPLWIFSEVWAKDVATVRPEILLADNGRLTVERLTPGKMAPVDLSSIKNSLGLKNSEIQGPSGLWWGKEGGYLLEFKAPWALLEVDENFEVVSQHRPRPRSSDDVYGMYPPFYMAPLGSGFLAFGDVTEPANEKRKFYSAFTFFDYNDNLQVFEETKVKVGSELRDRYSLTFMPFIATNDESGYVLFLGDEPSIGRFIPGRTVIEKLEYFPGDVKPRPSLTRLAGEPGTRQAYLFYQEMQKESFAAAVYSTSPGNLFLLSREALEGGKKAAWWIVSLDPFSGAERYRRRLPTEAANLNVVPGEEFWGLIEKAPVEPVTRWSAPYMKVTSLVLVPTPWIEEEGLEKLSSSVLNGLSLPSKAADCKVYVAPMH